MWPAALGSASNLSYDQQYKALIEIMKKLGISTVKVTHMEGCWGTSNGCSWS